MKQLANYGHSKKYEEIRKSQELQKYTLILKYCWWANKTTLITYRPYFRIIFVIYEVISYNAKKENTVVSTVIVPILLIIKQTSSSKVLISLLAIRLQYCLRFPLFWVSIKLQ